MIHDEVSRLNCYLHTTLHCKVADFIKLAPSLPDGEYPLVQGVAFCRIMSCDLKTADNCAIECHNEYVDLQSTIEGAEGITIFDRSSLKPKNNYDSENDVTFLHPGSEPLVHVTNTPGHFTLLFPEDAHRPGERCHGHPDRVRKLVVKIRKEAIF